MSYINFDKKQLINLEYSIQKEIIRSNRSGAYASTTIIGCNTRKYHGLLVVPQPWLDNDNHVLLSTIDATIIQREKDFNLGIHKFPGIYQPRGHKYIRDFETEPIPKITYRVGGVVLTLERIFSKNQNKILHKYTLLEAHSPTFLRFKPFLAFRNVHKLSKANIFADTKYMAIKNGTRYCMYEGYSPLYIQFSKKTEYTHVPHWYYNIEYPEEQKRGYEYQEDLFVPGFFELVIKKGESIIISASTDEENPAGLKRAFTSEINKRIPRSNFENCLNNSAEQFIVKRGNNTEIIAGFPWFGRWGRDTFISLPGLTLSTGQASVCKDVIDTMIRDIKGPLFPNVGYNDQSAYNSVDASLWFFWALQQYAIATRRVHNIWNEYHKKIKIILEGFRKGTEFNIRMLENGLLYAGCPGKALTWMDAIVDGNPVTQRAGCPVEVNALWYNAIMFSLEAALHANDHDFIHDWEPIAQIIPSSFEEAFWLDDKNYLADYIDGDYKDTSVRPNQVFAASLPYSPIDEEKRKGVLDKIQQKLLTPRGLRTLSPNHKDYQGIYAGDQRTRDLAYHQGTVWPWLLGAFAEAYLKIYDKNGLPLIENLYKGFHEVMTDHGIGTISEVYDGDPPHKAGGTISQAWSVAEILRIGKMVKQLKRKTSKKI